MVWQEILLEQGTLVAIIMATIQSVKSILPKKYLPAISWVIAGLIGMAFASFTGDSIATGFMYGIFAGMGGNGVYDQIKAVKANKDA
jgi:uncharacterized membrane protein